MRPSQEMQDDTDAYDPPPLVSSNKTILNMKPVSGSVGVGDTITDVGMISGVDSQLS
jgi:hypothetical protein